MAGLPGDDESGRGQRDAFTLIGGEAVPGICIRPCLRRGCQEEK